jgi:hypothetical protein
VKAVVPEAPTRPYWACFAAIAAVVVPALVLIRPGRVVDDGRLDLLVDPGGALASALGVWDPNRSLGTVAAGEVRRLWPLGTYHWLMDAARVPDWLAQRLWLAALLLAAAGGVLVIARAWRWRPSAALAAAAAYALSPVVATGALDAHALVPFAGLPWVLALAIASLRHRGWRHPVAFAVVLAAAGSGDATAATLLLAVPLAWIGHALWVSRETTRARAITTVAKVSLTVGALNAWWVVALTVQSTNGIDTARFGVPPGVVASTSSAAEVIRGLGRWTAYRGEVAEPYTQQPMLLLWSFVVPTAALVALGISRWRYRAYVIGLAVAGTLLAAAAHTGGPVSPIRALIELAGSSGPGLALRGLEGAGIVVVLALALGIGALVAAAAEQSVRRGTAAAAGVAVVALAALPVLWTGGLVPASAARNEVLPADTAAVARHLDRDGDASRVLELPGHENLRADGSSTLQAVLERPHAIRQGRPAGSAASTDLLRALDDRVQRGTLAPEALAPLARLLGVGDVVVRADEAPAAAELLSQAPGFGPVERFGDLATAPVTDPVEVVRAHAGSTVVLLSGSGAGIVDAASAGLLQGDELVRYSSTVTDDPDFTRTQLVGDRRLVITDTNRARAQRWTGTRDVDGFTESPEGGVLDHDPYDQRLRVQDDREGTQTVVDPGPLSVRATSYGPADRYRPDQRPALAADGDPGSAWLVPAGRAVGEALHLTTDEPVEPGAVVILQRPGQDGTAIGEVTLHFDGNDQEVVELDAASLTAPGQRVDVGEHRFRTLSIEIRSLTGSSPADSDVGLAEVDIAGLRTERWVRMPTDLLDAAGFRSSRYPLALVQTRLRTGDDTVDEEQSIQRIAELPTARAYRVTGTARATGGVTPDGTCRADLVDVDDRPVTVRLLAEDGGSRFRIEGCDDAGVVLPGGERRFSAAPSAATGIDIDQLVWSSDPVGADIPVGRVPAPSLAVTSRDAATVGLAVEDMRPGTPFWIILGQSHDPGWQLVESDEGTEVDGPHLVNGYANGFLVTSATADPAVELRFVPQNRVEVALLFSALGGLLAVALALPKPAPIRTAPSHRQEPLRRLRAFTYEGALPTKREARTVAAIGGIAGTLLAGPLVGIVLAAAGGFATRREEWRPVFTVVPALLLGGTAVALVLAQIEQRVPHTLDWPAEWGWAHVTTLTAVLLLGLDVVIDHVWRRGSLLE